MGNELERIIEVMKEYKKDEEKIDFLLRQLELFIDVKDHYKKIILNKDNKEGNE